MRWLNNTLLATIDGDKLMRGWNVPKGTFRINTKYQKCIASFNQSRPDCYIREVLILDAQHVLGIALKRHMDLYAFFVGIIISSSGVVKGEFLFVDYRACATGLLTRDGSIRVLDGKKIVIYDNTQEKFNILRFTADWCTILDNTHYKCGDGILYELRQFGLQGGCVLCPPTHEGGLRVVRLLDDLPVDRVSSDSKSHENQSTKNRQWGQCIIF